MLRALLACMSLHVLFAVPGVAQGPNSLSLDMFLMRALETNKGLAAARSRVSEAGGLVRQARVRPAPELEFTASSGRPFGTTGKEEYSLSYSYQIETAGKRSKRTEAAAKGTLVAQAEADEEVRQLRFRIASRYSDAFAKQEELKALDSLIAIQSELLRLIEARINEGAAAPLERQLISVDLGQAEARRAISMGQFESAQKELRTLSSFAGETRPVLLEPEPLPPELSLSTLQQRVIGSRADVQTARALLEQSEADLTLAEANGVPDIILLGGYTREYGGFDDLNGLDASGRLVPLKDKDDKLSIGIQIPIGTKRRNTGNVEAAKARAAGASLRREYAETAALLEVENAWHRVEGARRAVGIYDQGCLRNQSKT